MFWALLLLISHDDSYEWCVKLCPKLQVKTLYVPVFRQRLVTKMFWYVYCVAVAICRATRHLGAILRPLPDFTLLNTLCLHYYHNYILLVFLKLIK